MNFKHFNKDFPASVVVLFVAIPLCLGIASASGAPLTSGLIAGIVGGIIVGSLSGSSLGVSGPAAGLAVIVFDSIEQLPTFQAFLLVVVIAGIIQIILGVLKAGVLGYYFPSSVIKGMLAGIGIVITLKQIPHAFGYDADYEGDLGFFQSDGHNTLSELYYMLEFITPAALLLSVLSFGIIMLWDKKIKKLGGLFNLIPASIVAVIFGILYQVVTSSYWPEFAISSEHLVTVNIVSSFEDFQNFFTHPDFSQILNPQIYVLAITIAVVASLGGLVVRTAAIGTVVGSAGGRRCARMTL